MAGHENRYRRSDVYFFRTQPEIVKVLYDIAKRESLPVNVILEKIILDYAENELHGIELEW